jgi:FdhE protein
VDYLEGRAPDTVPDPELFHFVMGHALYPVLEAYAVAVAPPLRHQRSLRGDCPLCGGHPDFAALEGEAGERRLLCARCDTEWAAPRVGCPFCGEDDPARVGYFLTGEGAYRLYVCETCKGYIKTIDLRETWRRRPLSLERILTVGMDIGAAQQGYGAK